MDAVIAEFPGESTVPLGIHAVALRVRDMDRVADFYRGVVGLETIESDAGTTWLGAGGKAFLELRHSPEALPNDPAAAGLYHTAFLLPTRVALGQWLAQAAQKGVRLDGAADHLVSEAVYLADPEGNGIEIYADRPRSTWPWDTLAARPQIKMDNARLDIPGLVALAETPWAGAPPQTTIGHVHLQVGDVEAALRFYAAGLGMDVMMTRPGAAFLSTGGYHHHLGLNTWNSRGAGPRDPGRAGLASVTLVAADAGVMAGIAGRAGPSYPKDFRDPWGTELRIIPLEAR